MQRSLVTFTLATVILAAGGNTAVGSGLLIPAEPDLPPLAMLNHHVEISLVDQVAVTRVAQTFRNHTDRKLEATYVFPVPPGASVRNFVMWVNGSRMNGELLPSDRAKDIYTSIVRQTKNPAILDYIGSDLLSLKIYPVPANGDSRVEVSFTAVAKKENDLVSYVYPLETDRSSASTLEEFRLKMDVKSQQPIGTIYSPTHAIGIKRENDHQATIEFEQAGAELNRDFQIYYTTTGRDIGVTALEHRPVSDEDGYVMLLVSPRAELPQKQKIPRDIVFVIDTSGSMMQDNKIKQAREAMRQCLSGLDPDDRFALVQFATTVNPYRPELVSASPEQVAKAKGWVSDLWAGGGTAIHDALTTALEMRSDDADRMFTVVFFTDGQPTIGESDTDKILGDVVAKNTANTRIFSFGLGDDLNAVFLDQIAEQTRAVSSYVRPDEKIETKVASFFNKIHHPVLANLKLSITADVRLAEVYPPKLPDLFHGDQLVVLARYQGSGHAGVVLNGDVGPHKQRLVYELDFKQHADGKPFVEELWARRKVGYLLDQIRINGERQELVDEVVRLAKNYGITTPYTSYLIMPDAPVELAAAGKAPGGFAMPGWNAPPALAKRDGKSQEKLSEFARRVQTRGSSDLAINRGRYQDEAFRQSVANAKLGGARPARAASPLDDARRKIVAAQQLKGQLDRAASNFRAGNYRVNQVKKLGVDLSVCTNGLKRQNRLTANAVQRVNYRNCVEIGGVWIDEGYSAATKTVAVKAQSDAYFRILERQPRMKNVYQLGNHVVWITPNGTGLVIDSTDGKEQLSDREIDMLFVRS